VFLCVDEIIQEAKVIANIYWVIGNLSQNHTTSSSTNSILDNDNDNDDDNATTVTSGTNTTGTTTNRFGTTLINSLSLSAKIIKNSRRFNEKDLASIMNTHIRYFIDYPVVLQWICRSIVNLSKSYTMRMDMLDKGLVDSVTGVIQKYSLTTNNSNSNTGEVVDWANNAKESLLTNTPPPVNA